MIEKAVPFTIWIHPAAIKLVEAEAFRFNVSVEEYLSSAINASAADRIYLEPLRKELQELSNYFLKHKEK